MDKLRNIDFGKYNLENINLINYSCIDIKDKKYKAETEILAKDNDRLAYIEVHFNYNTKIIITTPVMVMPFGIDKSNGFQMKLQFTDYKNNKEMKIFHDFITNLEFKQMQHIGLTEEDSHLYNTQIYQDKGEKYDPLLSVKIPFIKNKFNVEVYNDNYVLNILNINRFSKVKCDIYIDKIWKYNEKYICKWKVDRIYVL